MADKVPFDNENNVEPEFIDKYIRAQVLLDESTNGGGNIDTVQRWIIDINSKPIWVTNNNPFSQPDSMRWS